jgi:hypothetical protein
MILSFFNIGLVQGVDFFQLSSTEDSARHSAHRTLSKGPNVSAKHVINNSAKHGINNDIVSALAGLSDAEYDKIIFQVTLQRQKKVPLGLKQCTAYAISPDWLSASCVNETSVDSAERPAINAIDGKSHELHPIFKRFNPYRGRLFDEYNLVDFLGFTIPRALYCNQAYMHQTEAHALRVRQCGHLVPSASITVQTAWPVISEEYFVSVVYSKTT